MPQAGESGGLQRPVLWVDVTPGPTQLRPDMTRAAIAEELKLEVVSSGERQHFGRVNVIGIRGPGVIVRYVSSDGATKLERQVALPVDPKRRTLVVAWVVCNLVRNEAAEILLEMAQRDLARQSSSIQQSTPSESDTLASVPAEPTPVATSTASTTNVVRQNASGARPMTSTVAVSGAVAAIRPEATRVNRFGAPRFINVALFAPSLAVPADAKEHAYYLSLGGAYSHVGAIDGFGLTWFVDAIDGHVNGATIAGIWSFSAQIRGVSIAGLGAASIGDLHGVEAAGLWLSRTGRVNGVQLGGLVTTANEELQGAQVSGLFSLSRGRSQGLQLTGGLALAGDDLDGVQLGMVGNIGRGQLLGAQVSGVFNVQNGNVEGIQVTGGYNHADDLHGLQLGVVNRARQARGLQIGMVNLSSEQSGFAIGLVNWSKGSRFQPIYFFQTPGLQNLGYRILSGHASSTISFGYDGARDRARTHFGVGAHASIDRFGLGIEIGYGWVLENMSNGPRDRAHELDLIGRASAELLKGWISVYAGGGASLPVAGRVPIEPAGLAQVGISVF